MKICDVGRAQMNAYIDDHRTELHDGKAMYQKVRLILAVLIVRLLHWPYFFFCCFMDVQYCRIRYDSADNGYRA